MVILLICVWEVRSSNVVRDTGCFDSGPSSIVSVMRGNKEALPQTMLQLLLHFFNPLFSNNATDLHTII